MTWRLERAEPAREDLIAIWHYIAIDDADAASDVVRGIERAFGQLADFPRLGRPADELVRGCRLLSQGGYLLLYRVEDASNIVRLLRVIHGRRDLPALLFEI